MGGVHYLAKKIVVSIIFTLGCTPVMVFTLCPALMMDYGMDALLI